MKPSTGICTSLLYVVASFSYGLIETCLYLLCRSYQLLRISGVPSGRVIFCLTPALEAPGYYQTPLRGVT
jgi:hypothetical protein